MKKILCALLGMILTLPGFAACPSGQVEQTYTSATGTVTQNGTPSPDNPIEPVFYKQGDMVLRKVGDVADSYDATTGKITRRVGVKVLDGTENWSSFHAQGTASYRISWSMATAALGTVRYSDVACTHLVGISFNSASENVIFFANDLNINFPYTSDFDTRAKCVQYLADQYAAGTPVTVYYPLATETTEDWNETTYCATNIKIATTAYNSARFSPVVTELNDTIATIRSVVTNTINQTKAIADLQATKQTRPNENCPAGKKCLLVEDDAGQPHWYEIIESASRLPAGYTELEYIESTGTQEIDTGVLPSAVDDIYVRFKNTTTDAGYLIGAAGDGRYNYVGIHNAFSGYGENWGGSSQYTGFSVPADTSNIHVIKVDLTSAPKFYLDNALKATQGTYATITSTYTLRVNANVYGDSKRCSARYYDVKLSKNGSLVRDFVPAKNSSGVVGMYDTVSGTFFTNAGTGTFTAGPEI